MPAIEPLCSLIGLTIPNLTKEENILLEMALFTSICNELKEIFRKQYRDYFRLRRFNTKKEDHMLETKLLQLIIKDILSSDEYNLQGIAHYTDTHQDVVEEVMSGRNTNPSAIFLRKLIDLHRSVRRDLYEMIMKKIAVQFLAVA